MKERPILFSAPMIRAILDGRKSQTRRVVGGLSKRFPFVKLNEAGRFDDPMAWGWKGAEDGADAPLGGWLEFCPYGVPGDRLWVRETFAAPPSMKELSLVCYKATDAELCEGPWQPSIFMPRWASRITLEVVNVRVERVQEISEIDAKAEGGPVLDGSYRAMFDAIWDRINAKRGHGWEVNPFVWVITFRRIGL